MSMESASTTEVVLRPLGADDFDAWRRAHLEGYANTLQYRLGLEPLQAAAVAEQDLAQALPDGLSTFGAHVVNVVHGGREVGTLWWGDHPHRPGAAYVFDVEIHESARGHGLGRAAMVAAENAARAAGMTAIGLSVSGENTIARGLYEALGYSAQSIVMLKPLTINEDHSSGSAP